jgi:hypothetical protein
MRKDMMTAKNQATSSLSLDDVKKTVSKWLYIKDHSVVDVTMATFVANKFRTDPLWLLIIAPPSFAKTEILRGFEGYDGAKYVSTMTPTTLVSGIKPKGKMKEPSLLLQLDGKVLILKDFTSILSLRNESQQEILGQLREIYDGKYDKFFGNGKVINWTGHVGFIGACTLAYDKYYSIAGALGERFILYRNKDDETVAIAKAAQDGVSKEGRMRKEIQDTVHGFLGQFEDLSDIRFDRNEVVNEKIIHLACFVACARTPVERDYRDGRILYQPQAEGPARITKQLMQLGYALTLVHKKEAMDEDIYSILKKIARDLVPPQRLRVMRHLWDKEATETARGWEKTKDVSDAVTIPARTTIMLLEDLMVTKLANRLRDGEGERVPYIWQLTERICEYITESEVFEAPDTEVPPGGLPF